MKMKFKIIFISILLVIISLLGISIARMYYFSNKYGYDVKKDYAYENSLHERSIKIRVLITKNFFEWPLTSSSYDTGFLRIKVNSTILGYVFEPFIEVEAGGNKERQFFERGGAGERYINISKICSLADMTGKKVVLKGYHLSWDPQDSEMVLFRNDTHAEGPIVVVAPHPDDAEIASFGFYRNRNASIITVTAGEGGKYKDDIIQKIDQETIRNLKSRIRTWDSIAVPMWGGIPPSKSYNLGYFDGTLRKMSENPEFPVINKFFKTSDVNIFRRYNVAPLPTGKNREAKWINLVADFEYLFKKIKPRIIVTPHPEFDAHPDHVFTSIAVFNALRNLNMKDGFLYLYTNHGVFSDYYPYGPSQSLVSLPPSFDNSTHIYSVYSHPLTLEQQREKLFALESFHDLRAAPQITDYGPIWLIKSYLVNFYKFFFYYLMDDESSYYRRAIRANELFFVIRFDDTEMFMKTFDADNESHSFTRQPRKK